MLNNLSRRRILLLAALVLACLQLASGLVRGDAFNTIVGAVLLIGSCLFWLADERGYTQHSPTWYAKLHREQRFAGMLVAFGLGCVVITVLYWWL